MNKLTIKNCPLCNGVQIDQVMACKDYYASGEAFELCRCHGCGFLFTQNFPVEGEIGRYYATPNYISHSDTRKGLVNFVYHWVRKYMLGCKVSLVIRESHKRKGSLLDIGTGTGYFPNAMQRKGWQVSAVEKNEKARDFAKKQFGLDVLPDNQLREFKAGSFDVITLWHVLEHLEDLNGVWEHLHGLLKDKGILIIAVPNSSSFDARKYQEHWAAYDVPRHLWHFTPDSIQRFGVKHGFILTGRYPMPFDAFYVSMLSEKNMNHSLYFIRGMLTGALAWFSSLAKKERSSSMIYIFRKR
ncbi:class I SAM-dependent methyltransferase [Bacteroidaceae bacterium HV4-6-C5C]|nr:class I SAM-dependent methyltransferase [Bacteroidaceae bacterium HV4-6-C5C]